MYHSFETNYKHQSRYSCNYFLWSCKWIKENWNLTKRKNEVHIFAVLEIGQYQYISEVIHTYNIHSANKFDHFLLQAQIWYPWMIDGGNHGDAHESDGAFVHWIFTACSTSAPVGLQGMTLFSLLKSLFRDLKRIAAVGDFNSSPAKRTDEGDGEGMLSVNCLGISITNAPLSPLWVEEDDEEVASSTPKELPALTWSWLPQNKTFVGKFRDSVEYPSTGLTSGIWISCSLDSGIEDSVETRFLHKGQVEWDWNHMLMQSKWKPWLHLGSRRAFSPSASSERQTAHSNPSLNSLGRKMTTGRELMTEGSSPWRAARTESRSARNTNLRRLCDRPASVLRLQNHRA